MYATALKQVGENRFLLCFSSMLLWLISVFASDQCVQHNCVVTDVAQFVDADGNPAALPGDVEKVVFEVQPETVGMYLQLFFARAS